MENMDLHRKDDLTWKPVETFEESVDAAEMFFTSLVENPARFDDLPDEEILHVHTEAAGRNRTGAIRAVILNVYTYVKRGLGIDEKPEKKDKVLIEA
jgi:hypothetical protein